MIASAPAESYRRTIETLVAEQACDAILAIFVPPLVTDPHDVAREIRAAAANADGVSVAAVFMTGEEIPAELAAHATGGGSGERPTATKGSGERAARAELRVPGFDFPEDAARALSHAVRYARWRKRPAGTVVRPSGCRPAAAAAIVARNLAGGGGWLSPRDVTALLECYGLPLVETRTVRTPREAVAAAAAIGRPVALKAIAPGLLHKSDAGGVLLNLDGAEAVRAGARKIRAAVARAGSRLEGLVVQPMASGDVELLMGVVHDESFGPVIACGAGGTRAELLGDVAVRITPLTDLDAREMLRSLRSYPLLEGYRGSPPCDVEALEDVLERLSALVQGHPEVVELDANPVVAGPRGALILDARVRVSEAPARKPEPSLRR